MFEIEIFGLQIEGGGRGRTWPPGPLAPTPVATSLQREQPPPSMLMIQS